MSPRVTLARQIKGPRDEGLRLRPVMVLSVEGDTATVDYRGAVITGVRCVGGPPPIGRAEALKRGGEFIVLGALQSDTPTVTWGGAPARWGA